MSTCISREGEYGEHKLDADHMCTRCYELDEDALNFELHQARATIETLTAERDTARANLAALAADMLVTDHGKPCWTCGRGPT